jgi:aminoglycoside/choline kinase family phosphotransferase
MTTLQPAASAPPAAPPDPIHVGSTVRSKLPFPGRFSELRPLPGDASNRRYFRLYLDEAPVASVIVMQLAEPEAFKASEEAVSGATAAIHELPFLNVRGHLAGAGVAVPNLYYHDQAAGLLYLEDFGDLLLSEACRDMTAAHIGELYRDAVDSLARLHLNATRPANQACIAFHRAFDVPLIMWEIDHFLEYGVVARQGRPMCADDFTPVRAEFQKIAELLAAQPPVFTHRDYHSRNLMVRDQPVGHTRLGILDFQDALMGPASYDLASLLRDAYIALDESLIDDLIERYLSRMADSGAVRPDRAAFRRLFDLTSIQRNLKAAGRFVYIDRVKHNPKFLADIPRLLGYVRRNLEKYPELSALRRHLAPYVPELQ